VRVALIVSTFDRPDALARVLASVARQRRTPDELVVADDGSGEATARLVRSHAAAAPYPVRHAWQPQAGFRVARARNAAVARTNAEYLLFVDGDMVLDPAFVADHVRAARSGAWVQGCRLPLSAAATAAVIGGAVPDTQRRHLDWRHRLQARRLPAASRMLTRLAPALLAVKACNQGLWRRDFAAVNGYDEEYVGWGSEDKDLCARLGIAGIRARGLLFGALAWHLHHPPAPRSEAARNAARLAAVRAAGAARCESGLDRHPATG
jgi:glycosyltransferase involved in cell wall biosynthesis